MANFLSGLLGAGMGFLTGGPAGAIAGGIGGLTASKKASQRTNQNSQQAMAAQNQMTGVGNNLLQRYQSASPMEQSILNYFFNRAGLGAGGNAPGGNGVGLGGAGSTFGGLGSLFGGQRGGAPMGTAPGVNGGQPFGGFGSRRTLPGFQAQSPQGQGTGLVNGNLGIYNSPQYQLLRQQAGEDIGKQMQNSQLEFGNSLANRGIDRSSVQQGGQAAITAGANKSYADFVRNLAMNAADKQDALANQALGSMQGALGSGGQAAGIFGQAAGLGQAGQQINQAQSNLQNNALGSAIGNAANYWALRGGGGGGGNQSDGGTGGTQGVDQNPNLTPADTAWMAHDAHGGHLQAGQPAVVGEQGSELYVPQFVPFPANANTGPFINPAAIGQGLSNGVDAYTMMLLQYLAGDGGKYGHMSPSDPANYGAMQLDGGDPGPPAFTRRIDPMITDPVHTAYQSYINTLGSPEMSLPARAMGGPVAQGQPYLIGEGGPEAFVPQQPGYVVPHNMLMALLDRRANGTAGSLNPPGWTGQSPNGPAGSLTLAGYSGNNPTGSAGSLNPQYWSGMPPVHPGIDPFGASSPHPLSTYLMNQSRS